MKSQNSPRKKNSSKNAFCENVSLPKTFLGVQKMRFVKNFPSTKKILGFKKAFCEIFFLSQKNAFCENFPLAVLRVRRRTSGVRADTKSILRRSAPAQNIRRRGPGNTKPKLRRSAPAQNIRRRSPGNTTKPILRRSAPAQNIRRRSRTTL